MSTVQTGSSAPSSLDMCSQIGSYSSPALIGFKQIKRPMHLPLITLLLQMKGGSTVNREAHSPNGIAVNVLQKQLSTGITARFGGSCQDQHREVNRPMRAGFGRWW